MAINISENQTAVEENAAAINQVLAAAGLDAEIYAEVVPVLYGIRLTQPATSTRTTAAYNQLLEDLNLETGN